MAIGLVCVSVVVLYFSSILLFLRLSKLLWCFILFCLLFFLRLSGLLWCCILWDY